MKILFCLIGWMKNYEGISEDDPIIGGGSWIKKFGYGCEEHNFSTYYKAAELCDFDIDDEYIDEYSEVEICCGFVNTSHGQIHIEKLGAGQNEEYISDVLVVWLASHPNEGGIRIVGWYEDAVVYRWECDPQADNEEDNSIDDNGKYLPYNIEALAAKCTIVDPETRTFRIPRATRSGAGIGQSQVWYAQGPKNHELVEIVKAYIASK